MADFEKDWDAETKKTGSFTSTTASPTSKVIRKKTDLSEKVEKLNLGESKQGFKWTPSSGEGFSFNFSV